MTACVPDKQRSSKRAVKSRPAGAASGATAGVRPAKVPEQWQDVWSAIEEMRAGGGAAVDT